ncbi:peptidase M16 [Pectobacterium araliae]|nr:peptidase M16 [Pectobacterium carotovorum subsp. carotovorum]
MIDENPTPMMTDVEPWGDDLELPSTTFVLANGLTVIVHEKHDMPLVSIAMLYRVGSRDEPAGKTGFAHLFEHLMFGGSENVPGSAVENLQKAGAIRLNASTGRDHTTYYETVPLGSLDYALFLESDRMGHFFPAINQTVLDQQRNVVLNEKLETEDGTYSKLYERRLKACYPPEHPYAHTVLGEVADLQTATLEDVRDWFRTHYIPSNAVLTLVGAIDVGMVRQKVETYFGHIPAGEPLFRPAVWVPAIPWGRRDVCQVKGKAASLMVCWNIPPYGDSDTILLSVAANMLASGMSSRLVERLVYQEKIAESVTTTIEYAAMVSQFVITVSACEGAELTRIEVLIDEVLQAFIHNEQNEEMLARVKMEQLSAFAASYSSTSSIADLLSASYAMTGSADGYRRIINQIQTAALVDIRLAAQRWLMAQRYVLEMRPFSYQQDGFPLPDRSRIPESVPTMPISLPVLQHAILDNGMDVALVEYQGQPSVNINLILPSIHEEKPGVSALTFSLVNESGAGDRDALALHSMLRKWGASLYVRWDTQSTSISLQCRSQHLSASLGLLADRFFRTTIRESDFERHIQQWADSLNAYKHEADNIIAYVLPGLMYPPGHLYRVPGGIEATRASLKQLTFSQCQAYLQRLLLTRKGKILVTGETSLEKIVPLLNHYFSSLLCVEGEIKPKDVAIPTRVNARVFLIDIPKAEHSIILAASLTPGMDWEYDAAFGLLSDVFDRGFSSRINKNLREDKNWTYGVSQWSSNSVGSSIQCLEVSVQADRTIQAMQEIMNEYCALNGERPVTEAELHEAKAARLLSIGGMLEGFDGINHMVEQVQCYLLPDDYWQNYIEQLNKTSLDEVNQLARQYKRSDTLTWIIAGDITVLRDGIRQLNFGDVQVINDIGESLYE